MVTMETKLISRWLKRENKMDNLQTLSAYIFGKFSCMWCSHENVKRYWNLDLQQMKVAEFPVKFIGEQKCI